MEKTIKLNECSSIFNCICKGVYELRAAGGVPPFRARYNLNAALQMQAEFELSQDVQTLWNKYPHIISDPESYVKATAQEDDTVEDGVVILSAKDPE